MKNNFFAKLGNFFLVSALLFNSFGVAFVQAAPVGSPDSIWMNPAISVLETDGHTSLMEMHNATESTVVLEFTIGGTATLDTDYSLRSEFPFPNGVPNILYLLPATGGVASTIGFPISVINDLSSEQNETVIINFTKAYYFGIPGSEEPVVGFTPLEVTVDIIDSTVVVVPPTVVASPTFDASTFVRAENGSLGGVATFVNNDNQTLDFNFEISGTASASDYIIGTTSHSIDSSNVVTFKENSVDVANGIIHDVVGGERRRFEFQPVDDLLVEGDETLIFTITSAIDSTGNVFDFPDIIHTVTISDNDYVLVVGVPDTEVVAGYTTTTLASDLIAQLGLTNATGISYDVTSSDESVASAVVVAGELIVTGHQFGTSDITITANYDGGVSTDTFMVTVVGNKVSVLFSTVPSITESSAGYTIQLQTERDIYNPNDPNGINVYFDVDASNATLGVDFTIADLLTDDNGSYVYIPKESRNGFITIVPIADNIEETDESIVVTLTHATPGLYNTVDETKNVFTLMLKDPVAPDTFISPVIIDATATSSKEIYLNDTFAINFLNIFSDDQTEPLFFSYFIGNESIASTLLWDYVGMLNLKGIAVGTTTVSLTATDNTNLSASATFDLTVKELPPTSVNHIPTIQTPIPTQNIDLHVLNTATISGTTLQNLFSDLDVDDNIVLTLTNNTDSTVVTTTVGTDFASLVLTGLKVGASVIELTGDDQHGGMVTSTFAVIVSDSTPIEGNNAPTLSTTTVFVDNEISLQETLGANLHLYFEDVDVDDTLTFSATTTDASIVTSGIDAGGQLTLTPHSYGTVQVIVTAIDSHGASISDTFSLKVNTPPELTANTLVNKQIDLKVSSSLLIDSNIIRGAFTDQDEEILTISVSDNSDNTVVTTTLGENDSLTLLGLKVGTSTIEITADDGYETIFTTFFVTVIDSTSEEETGNNGGNTGSSSGSSGGGGSTLLSNTDPQAAVTNGQEVTVEVNKEITFDASQSTDKENNIRFYFWNFGDGSDEVYYTLPTVKHTYNKIGNYTLTSKVRDAYGVESSAEVKVRVVAAKASANTETSNNTSNTNTESETTIETTTPTTDTTTSVDETVSTGNTNTNANTNTNNNNSANNIEEEIDIEEEIIEESTIEEEDNSFEEESVFENIVEESIKETPVGEVEEMPTWIKIIFGSGALAVVAGAGIAVNRVRKGI